MGLEVNLVGMGGQPLVGVVCFAPCKAAPSHSTPGFLPGPECLVSQKNQVQLQGQRGASAAPRISLEGQGNVVSRAVLSSWPGTQALCERSSD